MRRSTGSSLPAEILEGYPAMVDWPGSYYYKELMEAYPGREGAAQHPLARIVGEEHAPDDLGDASTATI